MSQHETIQDYLARNNKPRKGFFGTFYESNSLFFANLKLFFDCCKKPVFYVTSAAFLFIILQLYASIASDTNKTSMVLSITASILAVIIGIFIYALGLPTTALLAKDVYEGGELQKTDAYEKIIFSNIKNFLKFTFFEHFNCRNLF